MLVHGGVAASPKGDNEAGRLQLGLMVVLAYPRLQQWVHVYLRFAVGAIVVSYGVSKVCHTQFPSPSTGKRDEPYGDASPMGVL